MVFLFIHAFVEKATRYTKDEELPNGHSLPNNLCQSKHLKMLKLVRNFNE